LVSDSNNILVRWRNHFSQLLNVHCVNDDRQTEIHTTEPLVPEPSAFEFAMAIEKLKEANRQLLIKSQQGVEQFALKPVNLLILFGTRRNCLRSGRSRSFYLSTRRVIKQTVVIIDAYQFCQLLTKFYPTSCSQG
jgi:hypothetical protein